MNRKRIIIVDIHNDADLSRMIQELAFIKNYRWSDGTKSLVKDTIGYIIFRPESRGISYIDSHYIYLPEENECLVAINGYTEMGKLLSLIKDENNQIIIDNVTVKYKKGESTVKVGGLHIATAIFKQLTDCMSITTIGNHKVVEVTLDNRNTLSKDFINQVNDFVNKINQK